VSNLISGAGPSPEGLIERKVKQLRLMKMPIGNLRQRLIAGLGTGEGTVCSICASCIGCGEASQMICRLGWRYVLRLSNVVTGGCDPNCRYTTILVRNRTGLLVSGLRIAMRGLPSAFIVDCCGDNLYIYLCCCSGAEGSPWRHVPTEESLDSQSIEHEDLHHPVTCLTQQHVLEIEHGGTAGQKKSLKAFRSPHITWETTWGKGRNLL
jgi:hypothetical protein